MPNLSTENINPNLKKMIYGSGQTSHKKNKYQEATKPSNTPNKKRGYVFSGRQEYLKEV